MLIAAFILVISSSATIQFAVFSWRAGLLRTIAEPQVSENGALQACPNLLSSSSFQEVLAVYRDVCPNLSAGPALNLRTVSLYYAGMRFLGNLSKAILPTSGVGWTHREMALCTQYATVVLSQRLASNMAAANEVRSF
jgi:hypothetical protein